MRRSLLVAAVIATSWLPTSVMGQDDWGITRDPDRGTGPSRPRERRPNGARTKNRPAQPQTGDEATEQQGGARDRSAVLIERYLRVLDADPRESFAFQRLLDLYRERDGNVDALVRELERRVGANENPYASHMLLGHLYKAQGRSPEARASYERASSLRPADPTALVALARLDRAANDHVHAREHYDQAINAVRDATLRQELLREVGEVALDQNDYEAARNYYGRLAGTGERSVYLLTELARALAARNQHEKAVEEYQRVLTSLRGDNRIVAPILREMGKAQLEAGNVDDAITSLNRALRVAGDAAGVRAEIYDALLEAYRRGDRLPQLVEQLQREGRGFEQAELLGRLQDELGNESEALAAYRRALQIQPTHIDTRVRLVQLLSRSGRIEEVIAEYRTLVRSAPRESRFVVELAQLLMQVGRRDEALRIADQTSRQYARESTVHQALAELYSRWGEHERASREIAILSRIEPNDPAHLIALGAQQLEDGERAAALATWRRILTIDSNRARAHATLGGVYGDHDMLEEASQELAEAVRLDNDNLEYVRAYANILERLRRDEQAVEQWRRALELAGQDRATKREARQRIVAIWGRTRRLPQRIQEFERAFAATPPDVEAGRFLAEAYRRLGPDRADDAERILVRVIELERGDIESLLALERVRSARGNLAGAIEVLRKLVEADPPQAARYLQRMAEHALALYRDQEAVQYAAAAVERTPDDAAAHQRLGDLYRARQDIPRAVASYRRALELNDRLFPTYFDLAELHLARGELSEASRLYRQVLRASPDDDLVARAARAAIQVHLGQGTLDELERDVLPLALGHPQRPVFRKMVVELYDALAGPLIQAARQGGEAGDTARAKLERLGGRALKPMLEALADNDPAQRRIAIDILGHLGNENAAAPLLAAAEADGDTELRARALLAAGAIAPESMAPRFVALARGPERRLRATAAWALARTGGRVAIEAMRELVADGDPAVRTYAALGLGHARHRASGALLERLVREDRLPQVQAAAAWSLGPIGDPSHAPTLMVALRSRGGLVARAAASALGAIGDLRARDALARALFDPEADQREAAASALRRMSARPVDADPSNQTFPPPVAPSQPGEYVALLVRAGEPDPNRVVSIGPILDVIVSAANEALRGPVERVAAALDVLGAGDTVVGLGPLTAHLAVWPAADRTATEEALRAAATRLQPALLEVARHADASIRERAVRLLARMGTQEAVDSVVLALDDPEASVQRAAIDSLTEAHASFAAAAIPRLSRIVREHLQWSVRMRAAASLGRLRAAPATEVLIQVLREDDYAFVREAAARALSRIGGRQAMDALSAAATRDPERRVREAATQGLRDRQ